ncbi:MAG TPA: MFS transporter [Streptosporangiaceae bacterium]|nr:MFS transporter [Streptosporangiaceae bacterium]
MTNGTEPPVSDLAEIGQIDERGLRRAIQSLRDRRYRWWFVCQIFSSSGAMTQSVAQSWLVFRLTGNPFDLGVLGSVTWAPVLLGAAWGGALADRFDRRHLMMATQALFVVVNAIQAVLVATGRIQLWMIFTLAALNGAVMAVDSPTRQVYVFQLVGRERLASAVGLFEVVINASRVLGPAVGGVLLAAVGTAPCFVFNAASYLPMLWMLWVFKPDPPEREPAGSAGSGRRRGQPRGQPRGQRTGLRDGLRLVWHDPAIRSCILIATAASMVFNLGVPAPPFASRVLHLGGGGYGALMAAFGLGALPGALMAASARGEPDGRRLRVLTLLTGLAVILTAFSPVVLGAFLGLALSGFFSIWLIAAANTLVQLRAGPARRGRVMGIWTMALPGSYPVSGLLVALVSRASPRAGFSLSGVAMVAVALVTWGALAIRTSGNAAPFGTSLTDVPRVDAHRTLDETRSGHGT